MTHGNMFWVAGEEGMPRVVVGWDCFNYCTPSAFGTPSTPSAPSMPCIRTCRSGVLEKNHSKAPWDREGHR